MIDRLEIKNYKTLEDVVVDLGQINFFVGANGSGKSNLMEALGVLSAAADGLVDGQRLNNRGVRPSSVAAHSNSGFAGNPSPNLILGAFSEAATYEVVLETYAEYFVPSWRYRSEFWADSLGALIDRQTGENGEEVAGHGDAGNQSSSQSSVRNPSDGIGAASKSGWGMAALKFVVINPENPARILLSRLQEYVIFSPVSSVLRGVAPESQPTSPLGLSGGNLPQALSSFLAVARKNEYVEQVRREALSLIDWASDCTAKRSAGMPSPDGSEVFSSPLVVIEFLDRYMAEGRNSLSPTEVSEGALYVLFLAVLAAHPASPKLFAVDNADHGLNPRLARSLFRAFCSWLLESPAQPQALLTTHNPFVLDGLPLQDDRVRLFTVSRTNTGRTVVQRIVMDAKLLKMADEGWTLSRLWVMGHLGGVPHV